MCCGGNELTNFSQQSLRVKKSHTAIAPVICLGSTLWFQGAVREGRSATAALPGPVGLPQPDWGRRGDAGRHLPITWPRLPLLLWQHLPGSLPYHCQRLPQPGVWFALLLPFGELSLIWCRCVGRLMAGNEKLEIQKLCIFLPPCPLPFMLAILHPWVFFFFSFLSVSHKLKQ